MGKVEGVVISNHLLRVSHLVMDFLRVMLPVKQFQGHFGSCHLAQIPAARPKYFAEVFNLLFNMAFFSFHTLKKNLSVKTLSCATIVLFRSVEFQVSLPLALEMACGVSLSLGTCVKDNIFYLGEKISCYFHLMKCILLYPFLQATISNFL